MLTVYFSGTGNSQFIAEQFSQRMGCRVYSIEERVDFAPLIRAEDTIAFCYPIYGSCVPLIMREFVKQYKAEWDGKNIVILSTQLLFSGDGARVFTDLLSGVNCKVLYAEHFNMPNNISNVFFLRIASDQKIKKYAVRAERKLDKVCGNLKRGVEKKRGFNGFSKHLGWLSQRMYFQRFEEKAKKDVRITADCTVCSRCIAVCPMRNLSLVDNKIAQNKNCTLCYRCVNVCPQKAITVLVHAKVKKQYRGLGDWYIADEYRDEGT